MDDSAKPKLDCYYGMKCDREARDLIDESIKIFGREKTAENIRRSLKEGLLKAKSEINENIKSN